MIDATSGVRGKDSVTEAIRKTSSGAKQSASGSFQSLFASSAGVSGQSRSEIAAVSNRNIAALRMLRSGTSASASSSGGAVQPDAQSSFGTRASVLAADAPAAPLKADVVSSVPADDPITNLLKAMQDIGIDTSKLTVTPRQLTNWCPSGSWVDQEIQVSTQDGKSVYLAQDLLKRNYTIGAWDVQHMLQSPYA